MKENKTRANLPQQIKYLDLLIQMMWLTILFPFILIIITGIIGGIPSAIIYIFCCFFGKDFYKYMESEAQRFIREFLEPMLKYYSAITTNSNTCPICLELFSSINMVIQLPCSNEHVFHFKCLKIWMENKKTCPSCRQSIINEPLILLEDNDL